MGQMTVNRSAFWYPVVDSQAEFNSLPEVWRSGTQLTDFAVWRAKQLESMEAWARKNNIELVIVRTTPSYMNSMLGSDPDTSSNILRVCRKLMNLPHFNSETVFGEKS